MLGKPFNKIEPKARGLSYLDQWKAREENEPTDRYLSSFPVLDYAAE